MAVIVFVCVCVQSVESASITRGRGSAAAGSDWREQALAGSSTEKPQHVSLQGLMLFLKENMFISTELLQGVWVEITGGPRIVTNFLPWTHTLNSHTHTHTGVNVYFSCSEWAALCLVLFSWASHTQSSLPKPQGRVQQRWVSSAQPRRQQPD